MAHYIAYATEAGAGDRPREMLSQVRGMLSLGIWGVPTTAQLKLKLLPGDGLIVAVGAPYRQFVGDAVLSSRYRKFSETEIAALPAGLEFDHGITLARTRIWPRARLIEEVWPLTTKARSGHNRTGQFRGAINSVISVDAALIVAAGTGDANARADERAADATDSYQGANRLTDAEDEKVITLMNARRADEGKPPLTAEQEEQIRENRRSSRTRLYRA